MSKIRIYKNCFTYVGKIPSDKNYETFIVYDSDNCEAIYNYLISNKNYIYIGYNNIKFDAQILEYIIENKGLVNAEEIYDYAQAVINKEVKLKQTRSFKTRQIDLFTMWSYDTDQRRCSLKWLEFSLRMKKLRDLPFHHSKKLTKTQVTQVVSYNKYDVEVTDILFSMSKDKIELRKVLFDKYKKFDFFSKGDVSLGADTFLIDLSSEMKINVQDLERMRTYHSEIAIKNVIIHDRINTIKAPEFLEVINKYNNIVLKANAENLIELKGVLEHELVFNNIVFKYGLGGLHASVKNKLLIADENHFILDIDVKSFYPNQAIVNNLFPKHLSKIFIKLYKELYSRRESIPKSDLMNLALKLALNAIFGKSNSKYSYLFDTAFTLGITINGQLQLSSLAEQLTRCAKLIQVNTDGITLLVHKDKLELVDKVITWWQKKTELVLEKAEYKLMAIADVNNYLAITTSGKVKRKGKFAMYEDYINTEDYHKNPSSTIIGKALSEYYVNNIPVSSTVYSEEDIFEFLAGVKKKSNFEFLVSKANTKGYVELKKITDRVLRYYHSIEGSTIYKVTDKIGFTTLSKDETLTVLQNVSNTSVTKYTDLNKDWYIEEAQKIIDSLTLVNNNEFLNE